MTKKICKKGHIFYKSSDCPTCSVCEKEKTPKGPFADMAAPVRRALEHTGIKTLRQLSKKTEREVLDLHGIGPSSIPIFKMKLEKEGLAFKRPVNKEVSMRKLGQLKSSTPKKMKTYESFSAWEKEGSKINKLTKTVSAYVQAIAPQVEKTVKWGQGCFLKSGRPAIYIHSESDHVQLGFYNGAALKDPSKYLEGKGKYVRHIKIITESDLQEKDAGFFIKQVI